MSKRNHRQGHDSRSEAFTAQAVPRASPRPALPAAREHRLQSEAEKDLQQGHRDVLLRRHRGIRSSECE